MEKIFISLGSNLGDKLNNLEVACEQIEQLVGTIEKKSKIYETEPWGFETSDQFLNQVILVQTSKTADEVMKSLLLIENDLGRVRNDVQYSSRSIDLDILFYGDQTINTDLVNVPHPRLHARKFILIPLMDLKPLFYHPTLKKTIAEILNDCKDNLEVSIYKM
jgi:2-amino-4-hydroxy-6-hydroxymethyldihydropteridine diphosphokinase